VDIRCRAGRTGGTDRLNSANTGSWVVSPANPQVQTCPVTNQPPYDSRPPYIPGRSTVPQPQEQPYAWPGTQPVKTSFLRRLSPGRRAAVYIGGGFLALLLVCLGGSAVIGALSGKPKEQTNAANQQDATTGDTQQIASAPTRTAPHTSAAPTVESKTITETQPIPFTEKTVDDGSLAKGTRQVRTPGVNGVKTLTYKVTYTNGSETGRELVSDVVTQQPVVQVVAVGSKVAAPPPPPPAQSNCDPNYTGCVPIASDVDCQGGSGNGPAYVKGPIQVIGDDIYDLDSDHDGVACES
jgi:resuscitation-promoting factor RpfB